MHTKTYGFFYFLWLQHLSTLELLIVCVFYLIRIQVGNTNKNKLYKEINWFLLKTLISSKCLISVSFAFTQIWNNLGFKIGKLPQVRPMYRLSFSDSL